MAGIKVTQDAVNGAFGSAARDLDAVMTKMGKLVAYSASVSDKELVDLGFDQAEVDAIRAAVNDMNEFQKVFEGQGGKVFKSSISKLWGLGAF